MRSDLSRLVGWLAVLGIAACAAEARAEDLRFCYVSLDPLFSTGEFFEPIALDDWGRIYGNLFAADSLSHIAVIDRGTVDVLPQTGLVHAVNRLGVIGGSVVTDPETGAEQAAIFRYGRVEVLPKQPGEVTSWVTTLNDAGTAVAVSYTDTEGTVLLDQHGWVTPLDFSPDGQVPNFLHLNNRGQLSGSTSISPDRGFRYDIYTGALTVFPPVNPKTDKETWAQAINEQGDVLGYSFVNGGIERIGIWNGQGVFDEYFVEGTPEIPTVSNRLRFNEQGLIVITDTTFRSGLKSYVVPERGVRIDLEDITEGVPDALGPLWVVQDLNERGDMVGFGFGSGGFLLRRGGCGCDWR